MCSFREARRRLVARYYEALSELPPGVEPLFTLDHFTTSENVEVVAALDLYRASPDGRRDRQLVEAWCRRDDGRRQ